MFQYLHKMLNFGKKAIIVSIVFAVVIILFSYSISKTKSEQQPDNFIKNNRQEIYKVINNPDLQKTPAGRIKAYLYQTFACGILGEACTVNPNDGEKNYKHSFIGIIANVITVPFVSPPASAVYWAYDSLQRAGFVQTAYASEGFGFASFKPFMNVWRIFRDLAYMLLVLVLIGIGFMVMFRMKINPQTVISIENSLPKIVITLFLIAFSYAIAGFLVDLMYVAIAFSISLLSNNGTYYNVAEMQNKYLSGNLGVIWDSIFAVKLKGPTIFGIDFDKLIDIPGIPFLGPVLSMIFGFGGSDRPIFGGFNTLLYIGDAIGQILPLEINLSIRALTAGFGLIFGVGQLMIFVGQSGLYNALNNINVLAHSLGMIPEFIIRVIVALLLIIVIIPGLLIHGVGFIIAFVLLFTVIFLFIRLVVMLFKAYLNILLLVVFSPIIIMFEAIPGKNAFGYWIKHLIGEIITFPIIVVIFLIGRIMVNYLPSKGGSIAAPPMLGGFDPNALYVILGMGLIFIIPDLVKLAKGLIGIKEGLPISVGPGAFFSGAGSGLGSGIGLLGQFSTISLGIGALKGGLGIFGGSKNQVSMEESIVKAFNRINGPNPPP